MIEITQDASGVIIPLRVQPKASSDRIMGEHSGSLKVAVSAPPESGKANQAVVKLIAKALKLSKSSITIVAGQTSREKKIHINGTTAHAIRKMLGIA
ncbi:YggU family protein [bacterium]|nr:YggU family protein [bacterium]